MSTAAHGMPPQLTASGLRAQSPSIQSKHKENSENHQNTTPYLYLDRESPWPTCGEMIECIQCCCQTAFVIAKLCIQDAYREMNKNERRNRQ